MTDGHRRASEANNPEIFRLVPSHQTGYGGLEEHYERFDSPTRPTCKDGRTRTRDHIFTRGLAREGKEHTKRLEFFRKTKYERRRKHVSADEGV